MRTLMMVLGLWVTVSVVAAGLIALGGAIGHRRGLEEGRAAAGRDPQESPPPARVISLTAPVDPHGVDLHDVEQPVPIGAAGAGRRDRASPRPSAAGW